MDSDSKIVILSNHLDFFQEQLIDLKIVVEELGNRTKKLEDVPNTSSQNISFSSKQNVPNQQEIDKRNKENMELYNRVLKAEEQNTYLFKMMEQQSTIIKRAEEKIKQLESSIGDGAKKIEDKLNLQNASSDFVSNSHFKTVEQKINSIEEKINNTDSKIFSTEEKIKTNNSKLFDLEAKIKSSCQNNNDSKISELEAKINHVSNNHDFKLAELETKVKTVSQSMNDSSVSKKNEERIISLEFAVDRQKHIVNSIEEDKKKVKQLEDAFAYLKKNDRQATIQSQCDEQGKTILSMNEEIQKSKNNAQSIQSELSMCKKTIETLEESTKQFQEEIKSKNNEKKDDYVSALQNKIEKHNIRILSIEDRMKLHICLGNVCWKCTHVYDKIFPCISCNKKSCYDCVYCKDNGKETEYYCSSCFK